MLVQLNSVFRFAALGLLILCSPFALDGCARNNHRPEPWVDTLTVHFAPALRLGMSLADLRTADPRFQTPYQGRVYARVGFDEPNPFIGALIRFELGSDTLEENAVASRIMLYTASDSAKEVGNAIQLQLLRLAGAPAETGCRSNPDGSNDRVVSWSDRVGSRVRLYIPATSSRHGTYRPRTALHIFAPGSQPALDPSYRKGPC
jgi:hypothetical protein